MEKLLYKREVVCSWKRPVLKIAINSAIKIFLLLRIIAVTKLGTFVHTLLKKEEEYS